MFSECKTHSRFQLFMWIHANTDEVEFSLKRVIRSSVSDKKRKNFRDKEAPWENSHMKGAGMLVGNFELSNLGVFQALFIPNRDHIKTQTSKKTVTFNEGKDIIIQYFYSD